MLPPFYSTLYYFSCLSIIMRDLISTRLNLNSYTHSEYRMPKHQEEAVSLAANEFLLWRIGISEALEWPAVEGWKWNAKRWFKLKMSSCCNARGDHCTFISVTVSGFLFGYLLYRAHSIHLWNTILIRISVSKSRIQPEMDNSSSHWNKSNRIEL